MTYWSRVNLVRIKQILVYRLRTRGGKYARRNDYPQADTMNDQIREGRRGHSTGGRRREGPVKTPVNQKCGV